MATQRFRSSNANNLFLVPSLLLMFVLGYHERHVQFDQHTFILVLFALGAVLYAFWDSTRLYLEVRDDRTIVNSGYRTFGNDILDIRDIKYIYRARAFPVWFGPSLMLIYTTDDKGELRHSVVREQPYAQGTLKQFLLRIKTLKPTIELDPEYEAFLTDQIELRDASKNSIASIEKRLRDRGEHWDRATRFLNKL
jgi:hypothetical protein